MKTFDFIIEVSFFHGKSSKTAKLLNFTYPEAFSVFNDLKLKYCNSNFPFREIIMTVFFPKNEKQVCNYLCSTFLDDDEPAF